MKKRAEGWELYDNDESAVENGTPFRVEYMHKGDIRFLYFAMKYEAFIWVQNNPEAELPEIKDLIANQQLYPKP